VEVETYEVSYYYSTERILEVVAYYYFHSVGED
jgi:hypothetical protein